VEIKLSSQLKSRDVSEAKTVSIFNVEDLNQVADHHEASKADVK
jgi:hypothetical protein